MSSPAALAPESAVTVTGASVARASVLSSISKLGAIVASSVKANRTLENHY